MSYLFLISSIASGIIIGGGVLGCVARWLHTESELKHMYEAYGRVAGLHDEMCTKYWELLKNHDELKKTMELPPASEKPFLSTAS